MEDDAKNNTTSPVKLNSSPNNFIDTEGKLNSLKNFWDTMLFNDINAKIYLNLLSKYI